MTTPAVVAELTARRRPRGGAEGETSEDPHGPPADGDAPGSRRARRRGEYRSFLTFDNSPDALDLVLEQTNRWLREKNFDVSLDESRIHAAGGRILTVVHRRSSHCHDLRLLLTEPNTNTGTWETEVTMHMPERDAGWLAIHVSNDQGIVAAPPRLVRRILDVVDAYDGPLHLYSEATTTPTPDVDDLLEAICGAERHGLMFVVGTADVVPAGGPTFAEFQKRAAVWSRDVVGLGQVVVLDPLATAAFNEGIGATHGVDPWTIRTYAPEPDPAWGADARRHRIFSAARLRATHDREIGRILGFSARAHAADRRLPTSVASADRDLRRATDRLILDGIFAMPERDDLRTPTSTVATAMPDIETQVPDRVTNPPEAASVVETVDTVGTEDPALVEEDAASSSVLEEALTRVDVDSLSARVLELEEQLDLVRSALQLEEVTTETLAASRSRLDEAAANATIKAAYATEMAELARARLEQQQEKVEQLEDDVLFHREYAFLADEQRDEAEIRARRAAEEAQYLRKQLAAAHQYDVAYGAVPEEAFGTYPESFEDLLGRMNDELEARGVIFTGDGDVVSGLDAQDSTGRLVRSTWECLTALAGYVQAKKDGACTLGLHGYLTDAPAGYSVVSRNKFASKESTSTMNKFGEERRFDVPPAVCPDGTVLMEAHFKLGTLGIVSPRMHLHDDTSGTGNVYVGYIGPHLTTEQTN
ncbi:MAG TPA: hypothetical protein VMF51_14245 [Nocardioides sp.]|uniref:hypothetical protein n=1 Tax=Nocardioides sp. TaxID=35761 RepID=UPI002BE0F117|nr:hypothetical protein [Nocardioides sp.]HTW16291.1 hypothetical protein [Nocardioides sp.]